MVLTIRLGPLQVKPNLCPLFPAVRTRTKSPFEKSTGCTLVFLLCALIDCCLRFVTRPITSLCIRSNAFCICSTLINCRARMSSTVPCEIESLNGNDKANGRVGFIPQKTSSGVLKIRGSSFLLAPNPFRGA